MKYEIGTRIQVQGQKVNAENGEFEITLHFPQPNGNDYFQWRRLKKDGSVNMTESTNNHRGHRENWLTKNATVIEGVTA